MTAAKYLMAGPCDELGGEQLYWSETEGWVSLASATCYTIDEARSFRYLPLQFSRWENQGDMNNHDRALTCARVIHGYDVNPEWMGDARVSVEDIEDTCIGDMLVNLMHLCDALSIPFDEMLRIARDCYFDDIMSPSTGGEYA